MTRTIGHALLVATTVLMVGGCTTTSSSTPTTTAPEVVLAAAGQQLDRTAVPWGKVGSGWLLALWGPNPGYGAGPPPRGVVTADHVKTTIYLINPLGGRYAIATLDPPLNFQLASWSGDGKRALLTTTQDGGSMVLHQLNLETGEVSAATTLPVSAGGVVDSAIYSQPLGKALLVTSNQGSVTELVRFGLDGARQQGWPATYSVVGDYSGSQLSFPDGTSLVLGAKKGVVVVTNAGTVTRQIAVAGAMSCAPMRWFARGTAVVNCLSQSGVNQLFVATVETGDVSPLTAAPVPPDYGDINAWKTASATYIQSLGGCGYAYLSQLNRAGTTTHVTVPGVDQSKSTLIVTAFNGSLALHATVSCGSGTSVLWFNPTTDKTTVALGPPVNGGGVISVLAFPSPTS